MNVLSIGLSIFVLITSIFLVAVLIRWAFFWLRGRSAGPLHSNWVPAQVCSGDDSLGHPDLKKISELRDIKRVK
jgi:hypothetical protein